MYKNKICIVTGAASGIGQALSEYLIKNGATVVFADIQKDRLDKLLADLDCPNAHGFAVDVTCQKEVKNLIESTYKKFGKIDYLFNNAGIGGTAPIENVSLDFWKKILDVDLWSVIYAINSVIPIMKKQKSGHIVNTSSIAGLLAFPYQAPYCVAKFAVTALGESLRYELKNDNIKVTTICPSDVATNIYSTVVDGKKISISPPKNAITVNDAVEYISKGLEEGEPIIILPAEVKELYKSSISNKEKFDDFCFEMAQVRRKNFKEKGNYYE